MFTANATTGAYAVSATASGVTGTVNFNLTNTAAPAETIAATSGTQSAAVITGFAAPLVATVTPAVQGVAVTFTAPGTGASGKFASGTTTETDTTDANGLATSSTFTANATTGAYAVSATATGVTAPATFNLTNTAAASLAPGNYVYSLSGTELITAQLLSRRSHSLSQVTGQPSPTANRTTPTLPSTITTLLTEDRRPQQ